jgi:hypothetical protein
MSVFIRILEGVEIEVELLKARVADRMRILLWSLLAHADKVHTCPRRLGAQRQIQ